MIKSSVAESNIENYSENIEAIDDEDQTIKLISLHNRTQTLKKIYSELSESLKKRKTLFDDVTLAMREANVSSKK